MQGGAEEEAVVEEKMTSMFIPAIESSVQEFVGKWQDRDETSNFFQKWVGRGRVGRVQGQALDWAVWQGCRLVGGGRAGADPMWVA